MVSGPFVYSADSTRCPAPRRAFRENRRIPHPWCAGQAATRSS